jgi:hypothetical protein
VATGIPNPVYGSPISSANTLDDRRRAVEARRDIDQLMQLSAA